MDKICFTEMSLGKRSKSFNEIVAETKISDGDDKLLDTETAIIEIISLLKVGRSNGRSVYLVGNGGSAGVASHSVTDFINVAGLKATTLHDPSLMTCMANDYGYESAFAKIISIVGQEGDILIAISSSGQSKNICNAAEKMTAMGGSVVTLSGFKGDNPLRGLGHYNIWLDSSDYGMVEIGHQFVLHNIADRFK